jgi:branched-chain amino acid transport system substrate-binding protein
MFSSLMSRRQMMAGIGASSALLLGCKEGCNKSQRPIKVGVLLTLSGPQGGIGAQLEQGLMLALERAGMQLGGRKIEIVRVDDRNDAGAGAAAAKKLIDVDKVDVIVGPSHSHVLLAMRNIIHESKMILINPSAGATQVAGELCSPYIFATCRTNALYSESMGRYLAQKEVKTVAVAAANYAAGVDVVKGFRETFVQEGKGKIVAELLPPLTTTDFTPFLKQMEAANAEAAFAFFVGDLAVNFIKQYDQLGLKEKLPLYTTGYTVEQDVLPAQGKAALGVFSTSVYGPFLDNNANKKFAPAYKDKYGTYPSEYSVLGFDAGQLLLAGLTSAKGNVDNREALVAAIKSATIESPRGAFKLGPNQTPVQDSYLRQVVTVDGQQVNKIIATTWPGYYYPGDGCNLPGVKR